MAQIYTRVYSYTKQTSWTAKRRSIPFGEFSVSGATDKNIGQIVSIRCESCHSSSTYATWTLTDRLVLSDGKTFDSDPVTHYIAKNAQVWFSGSFPNLPTAEEFAQISEVQILDNSGSPESNGNLTWKAFPERPISLIVDFYDQPPVKYAPQVTTFAVERVTADGTPNIEGGYIAATIKLALASYAPVSDAVLKLYTSTSANALGAETDLTGRIPELLNGVALNTTVITGEYSPGTTFYFTLVFFIDKEVATASAQAFRAKAPIHITNYGVAFGGFSSATESDPKEEFHNPVVFHRGFSVGGGSDMLAAMGIQHGKTDTVTISADKVTEHTVTFPAAFSSAPNVVVSFDSTGKDMTTGGRWDYMTLTVCDITATGFTVRVKNGTSSTFNLPLQWIAIGTM